MNKVGNKVGSKANSDTKLDSEESGNRCNKVSNKVSNNGDITIERRQDSGEYIEIAKFKGKYTTSAVLVVVVIGILLAMYGCTSTSTYTLNSTQIQNVGTDIKVSSEVTTKVETKTKSVNQVKIL